MVKKLVAIMMVFSLLYAPVSYFGHDNATTVSARSYRSGVKSFNRNRAPITSPFKKQQTNKSTTNNFSKKAFSSRTRGGFMRGLFFGGMAGLLFGGMLSHLGGLGTLLGFAINLLIIFLVISILFRAISFLLFRRKRQNGDTWRR